MAAVLTDRIELFAANADRMKGEFIWHSGHIKRHSALLYAARDRAIDCAALADCHQFIAASTGRFSSFRGIASLILATVLSLQENRERFLLDALEVYGELNAAKFWKSDYLAIAAFQIAADVPPAEHARAIERARAFYGGMKSNHRFYTGQDDVILAALFGISGIDVDEAIGRMEQTFQRLRQNFAPGNGLHALAQVLTLGGKDRSDAARVVDISDAMRNAGLRMDRQYVMSALGLLTLIPADARTLADEVAQAHALLRERRGFGSLSVTKQHLLLLCSAVVSQHHAASLPSGAPQGPLLQAIASGIAAQQTIAAVVAANAAASS